jgi:DivIVA domain-containing protein
MLSTGDAMPLTPQEVASKVFGPTRMRRGYDENEVDAFLDSVEAELTRLNTENERLRAELKLAGRPVPEAEPVEAASAQPTEVAEATVVEPVVEPVAETVVETPPAPPAPPAIAEAAPVETSPAKVAPAPSEPVETQVTRMLVLAQQTADAAINEAQMDADRTRGAARLEAERVLTEARTRAAEELGAMERSKASLETQVEQLQTFEREYRQRLRAYLAMQLSELDADGGVLPAVEMPKPHILDVADTGDSAPEASHDSHDSHEGGSNGSGAAPESGNSDSAESVDVPSLTAGLSDPPGFGAVWSPESGESQQGTASFIGSPVGPAGHSGLAGHAGHIFDMGGDGPRSSGYGPLS